MWQEIDKERRSAEHLFYVSLKYTKTCDVILNLIERWQNMIEKSINAILEKAKKKKLIKIMPQAPRAKVNLLLATFKKEKIVKEALEIYMFFKNLPKLEQIREGEFRKNVNLKVISCGKTININLEKLKQWQETLERFLSFVKHFIK
jgi:hypothetical protein